MTDDNLRKIQKMTNSHGWVYVRMSELTIGDVFRIFESDSIYRDQNGKTFWSVLEPSYKNDDGIWTVSVVK